MDVELQKTIMTLIIGYTCVGVFVATSVITVLSLIGLVKLDPAMRNKLFGVLVVEIVSIGVGVFAGLLNVNPAPLNEHVAQLSAFKETVTAAPAKGMTLLRVSTPEPHNDKPLVFFHIRADSQRAAAETLRTALTGAGDIQVPGIQRVEVGPSRNELRYFKRADATQAEAIGQMLKAKGLDAVVKLIGGFEDSATIGAHHYELWLAPPG